MKLTILRLLITFFALAPLLLADSDVDVIREPAPHKDRGNTTLIDVSSASIASVSDARSLIKEALEKGVVHDGTGVADRALGPSDLDLSDRSMYVLIHVLKWKDPDANNPSKPQAVDTQNWFVYNPRTKWRQEDFTDRKRLFGSKNVWILFIHLNAVDSYNYDIEYHFTLKDITPAPLGNFLNLVSLFSGGAEATQTRHTFWGMYRVPINHLPDQILASGKAIQKVPNNSADVEMAKQEVSFQNEGRYYLDFGVAVPIRSIKQTTIDTTNDTVTPTTTNKQAAFGVLEVFPVKRDLANPTFSIVPYLVTGAIIGSQPLHKILLAAGWGPQFAQFYFGTMFVKQQSLATNKAVQDSYEPQFSFGIILTARGFTNLMKKVK